MRGFLLLAVLTAAAGVLAGCRSTPPPPADGLTPDQRYALQMQSLAIVRDIVNRTTPVLPSLTTVPATQSATLPTTGPVDPGAARGEPGGKVTRVLLVWLKDPGDAAARRAVLAAAGSLRGVPGVADVRAGVVAPSTRPTTTADAPPDVGVVVTFASPAAQRDALAHPVLQQAIADVLKPNAARYRYHDFVTGAEKNLPTNEHE